MNQRIATATCFLAFLASACLAQTSGGFVRMQVTSVFEGFSSTSPVPYRVVVENSGPATRGVLSVEASGTTSRTTVDLPTGSRKALTVYPANIDGYSQINFALNLPRRRIVSRVSPDFASVGGGPAVAVLSDVTGQAAFLRARASAVTGAPPVAGMPDTAIRDYYATPEATPDRAAGYAGFGAVILADGTERLNDRQVAALREYVLTGGTLAFLGGASSPVLADRRWADLLPITNPRLREGTPRSAGLAAPLPRLSYIDGTLRPGTNRPVSGSPIAFARGYGAGKVVLIAANPFEAPLRDYAARRSLVTRSLGIYDLAYVKAWLDADELNATQQITMVASPNPAERQSNPFQLQLPPIGTILGLLVAYLLIVVPVNFLVLRRLGRLELAWLTAPVISLGFAGVFFTFARDLYSANLSKSTSGTVIVEGSRPDGVFVGTTQLFVPKAGSIDLGLQNVEQLTFQGAYDEYGRRSNTEGSTVDDGEVRVPDLVTPALAFRQIFYTQRVTTVPLVEAVASRRGDVIQVEVVNRTGTSLQRLDVLAGANVLMLQNLKAGERRSTQIVPVTRNAESGLARVLVRRNHIALKYNAPVTGLGPTLPARDVGQPPTIVRFIPVGGRL